MDIKPVDQSIKNLLEGSFYKIPRFQRPYSWEEENVLDFWNDAIGSEVADYFIGSFILYTRPGESAMFYVVDGQQRLTTITLLLAAVRDAFDNLGASGRAQGVQKLIERPDINNDMQFVLQTETSYPYFQDHIQKHGTPTTQPVLGPEEATLKDAYTFLRTQVDRALSAIDADTTVPEARRDALKQEKLEAIRDRILRLHLISVRLDNDDDAYLIFETLNTRGKDLTVSDLVKNHLTRLLRPTHKGVDIAKDKWTGILELFASSAANIDVNRFLHHNWISRYPYITEKQLFREIKRVIDAPRAAKFLDDLVADAHRYRVVMEPSSQKWSKQELDVYQSLRFLNRFRVVQPVPMTIAILRAYDAKVLKLRQVRDVLQTMEDFHAQFTGVTSQRTGGGTALMYASSARQLTEAKSSDEAGAVLKDFTDKLKERVPALAEFEASFMEIVFTDEATRQKALVQYLLERLDRHRRKGAVANFDAMTIEHIAPQRPPKAGTPATLVGRMGNLVFVDAELNEKMANKSFEQKLKLLKQSAVPLDPILESATQWTDDEIEKRGIHMSLVLYNEVFKL